MKQLNKYDEKKKSALDSQILLDKYSNSVKQNLFEFCKELSRFRQNKYYYLVGDYNSFEDYCWDKFRMSRTAADRHALVGLFLRTFTPKDLNDSAFVSLGNFENLGISKYYVFASAYFRNQELFKKLLTLDINNMTFKELCREVAVWESIIVVKNDVEFKGDVTELRDTIETVANDIRQERFTSTSSASKQYDDTVKSYINSVMSFRAECERLFRFLEDNVDSELFDKCTLYGVLEDVLHHCDDDLNIFMG